MLTAHEKLAVRRLRERGHSKASCTMLIQVTRLMGLEISDMSEAFINRYDEVEEYLGSVGERK